MGILRGVHSSSMTVHYRFRERFESEEGTPLDSPSVYGLTKGLGEGILSVLCAVVRHEHRGSKDHRRRGSTKAGYARSRNLR